MDKAFLYTICLQMTTHDSVGQNLYSNYSTMAQLHHYPGVVGATNHHQVYQPHPQGAHPQAQQQPWPRPGQYPYPYCGGTTAAAAAAAAAAYIPNQYQSTGPAPGLHGAPAAGMGLGSAAQSSGYYPNFQTRLQAMATQSIAKDNPQVSMRLKNFLNNITFYWR